MKKVLRIIISCVFILFIVKGIFAQPVEGKKFEFSTSASMWNVKFEGDPDSETVFNIPLRIGFYLFKGLEIEPEVFLTLPEDGEETGILVLGNLAYNFKATDHVNLFILGGLGFGNSVQSFGIAWDYDESISVLNFGGGIKYLIGNSAALRLEYRFTSYSVDGDHHRTDNNLYLGVSLFF